MWNLNCLYENLNLLKMYTNIFRILSYKLGISKKMGRQNIFIDYSTQPMLSTDFLGHALWNSSYSEYNWAWNPLSQFFKLWNLGALLQISLFPANIYLNCCKSVFYARRDPDIMKCLLHREDNFEEQTVTI